MKTLQQVIKCYKSDTLDGRDLSRLSMFIPSKDLSKIGVSLKDGVTPEEFDATRKEFTRENILSQLEEDLDFAFEKALDQRGLSSCCMFEVIRMWNWILEEGLEDWDENDYAMYGLPLYKATALKYGFDNPIGNDRGDEDKYGC